MPERQKKNGGLWFARGVSALADTMGTEIEQWTKMGQGNFVHRKEVNRFQILISHLVNDKNNDLTYFSPMFHSHTTGFLGV